MPLECNQFIAPGNKCPKCQAENPETKQFCADCGTQLPSSRDVHPQATETLQTPFKELTTGSTFAGRYQVIEELGKGGMGEVYKARDTRLDRTVAIKILPPEVSADPVRRTRFELEAKTIAGLNHPNICTLHDVGEQDGTTFLVMEHLTGETLGQRLQKGPLPLDQALMVATEIAGALAAAHRQGVIHRDLKPGNVMLTKTGAKLLDFGLAKLTGRGEQLDAGHLASVPTQSIPLTGEGTIVGTIQYMAPEQLEGKPADARTDLWALGAILYEMLTGKRAFEGTSEASLITAIMSVETTAISALQPLTPPGVDRLVKRCLAKARDDRWDSAHDVADDLRWLRETSSTGALTEVQPRRRRAIRLAAPVRFLLSDQVPASIESDPQRSFAVSRDGQRVAFVVERDGVRRVYLREMQTIQPSVIPGTEDAMAPFFSPDGQRIGFFANGRLKAVSLAGGTPVVLAEFVHARGATWTQDDTIIFSPGTDTGLWQVPARGGPARVVAQPDPAKGERGYRWPEVLPGGDAVVFTLATSDIQSFDDARLVVRSLRTGEQRELIRGGSFATCTATGHLLFARAGALMAVPFDVTRRVVTGAAKPVLDGLVTYPINGAAQYALGADGTLVYIAGQAVSRQATLNWVDTTGKTTMLGTPLAAYQAVSIAPDARYVALDIDAANAGIWLLDLERTSVTRLTLEWSNNAPFWTPDGARIGFLSARGGARRLFWQAAEGGALPEPLTPARPSQAGVGSWAPDGRVLIFSELTQESGWDIWTQAMGGEPCLKPFLQTPFNETNPRFSPDGSWVAYESDETGRTEVYALPFPGPGRKWRISTDGGTQPLWARDGRELFYRDGDAIMGVTIQTSPSFSPARPRLLFRKGSGTAQPYAYDVAPDGLFLMIEALPPPDLGPLMVVLNWHA
jgi:serine/threonine-protein kinase